MIKKPKKEEFSMSGRNKQLRELNLPRVFWGIGHYMTGEREYRHDETELCGFVYERKKRYPALLGAVAFDTNGGRQWSHQVVNAFGELVRTGVLKSWDHKPHTYFFDGKVCDIHFQRDLSDLPKRVLEEMQALASEFQSEFSRDKQSRQQ